MDESAEWDINWHFLVAFKITCIKKVLEIIIISIIYQTNLFIYAYEHIYNIYANYIIL